MCLTLDMPLHLTGSHMFHHSDGTKNESVLKVFKGYANVKGLYFLLQEELALERQVKNPI